MTRDAETIVAVAASDAAEVRAAMLETAGCDCIT
jgi:hypothetical protein